MPPTTTRDSDQVAGSSLSVAVEKGQLFLATTKVPEPGSCAWNGIFSSRAEAKINKTFHHGLFTGKLSDGKAVQGGSLTASQS